MAAAGCGKKVDAPPVPDLIEALKSPSEVTQRQALLGLMKHGGDAAPAVPAVVAFIRKYSKTKRYEDVRFAFIVLEGSGRAALPLLQELFQDVDPDLRRAAAGSLVSLVRGELWRSAEDTAADGVGILLDGMKHKERLPEATEDLISVCRGIRNDKLSPNLLKPAVPHFADLLHSEQPELNDLGFRGLYCLGPVARETLPQLRELAADQRSPIQKQAVMLIEVISGNRSEMK
jgi:HEAT repeat protein